MSITGNQNVDLALILGLVVIIGLGLIFNRQFIVAIKGFRFQTKPPAQPKRPQTTVAKGAKIEGGSVANLTGEDGVEGEGEARDVGVGENMEIRNATVGDITGRRSRIDEKDRP
jgi:hypothetical protein